MELGLVSLAVHDYDEAIRFYVDRAGFELVADEPAEASDGTAKRWVVVRPPGGRTGLLLAEASSELQRRAVGAQVGDRVGFFLHTDDFEADHDRLHRAGVRFLSPPRDEPYGRVAVWEDLYGNRWDLIGPVTAPTPGGDTFPRPGDVGRILIGEAELSRRIAELGAEITEDYAGRNPLLIGVLKGSLLFVADLMRAIRGPLEVDFLAVSSYGAATKSSGVVRIVKDLDHHVTGRDVVVVEDIVDTGLTLRYLLDYLSQQQPASLRTCSLLVREADRPADITVDYVGFRLPPAYVIGYGLDVDQQYRQLPYIAEYGRAEGSGPAESADTIRANT